MAKWRDVSKKLQQIEQWASEENTDREIYEKLGIGKDTYYRYLKSKPDFCEAIKKGREKSLGIKIRSVEDAQYKLACGHTVEETRTEITILPAKDEHGKPLEVRKVIKTEKYVPPNPLAQNLFLTHRDPENYKNISKVEVSGKDGGEIVVNYREQLIERLTAITERRKTEELRSIAIGEGSDGSDVRLEDMGETEPTTDEG